MFTKHVSQLNYADIDDLVNSRKEREGYHLDFKGEFGNLDKAKKELSKDVSAFANTGGGFLIIGVDKNYKITGIDNIIQNKAIDEWLNQILSSNIEPPVFYFDPKVIHIPDSDKVIVVLQIPESTKKPHIVTEWNNYHIRINDSSKSANHNQIRDMFEFSKNRTDEFNEFLKKKNLSDIDSPDFGANQNSKQLFSEIPTKLNRTTPFVIFSLFPKYPNEEKVSLPFNEFYSWLLNNNKGYSPCPHQSLFHGHYSYDLRLDGLVLKNMNVNEVSSYFEVLHNGYVEAGFSDSFIQVYSDQQSGKLNGIVTLTPIVIYEMLLLGFARKFYDFAKYYDEVLLQVSFANTLGFHTWGHHNKYRMGFRGSPPSNRQHNNFKLTYRFNPKTLTDEQIEQIAKHHSESICRAFGLEQDYCFVDGKLSLAEMNHFNL